MRRSTFTRAIMLAGAVALALVLALATAPPVQDAVFRSFLDRQLSVDRGELFAPGALRVIFCGTSAPPPSPGRAKTCTLVIAGDRAFLVDAGPKSSDNLGAWRVPLERIEAVLLTHFHSDHIGELGEYGLLAWAAGRQSDLPVYGPGGVGQIVDGFNAAYATDRAYRLAHHGALLSVNGGRLSAVDFGLAEPELRAALEAEKIILEDRGLRITAFQVDHEPVYPAVGYRFDYAGRSVVISGDTAWSANLLANARDADVLIVEGQAESLREPLAAAAERAGHAQVAGLMRDVKSYHLDPPEAARLADQAAARLLVYTHLGPLAPRNALMEAIFSRDVQRRSGRWRIAKDGLVLELAQDSEAIKAGALR